MTPGAREACGSFVPTIVSGENLVCYVSFPHRECSVVCVLCYLVGGVFVAFLHLYLQPQVNEVRVMLVTQTLPPYSFSLWLTAPF